MLISSPWSGNHRGTLFHLSSEGKSTPSQSEGDQGQGPKRDMLCYEQWRESGRGAPARQTGQPPAHPGGSAASLPA